MVINSDLDLEIEFQPSIGIFFGNALHYMLAYFRLLSSIVRSSQKSMQQIPRYLGISKERV